MSSRARAEDTPDRPPLVAVRPTALRPAVDLEALYDAAWRDVYRYAMALTQSADEADDVAAETFERAVRHWDHVPERPLPWLLLTARRIATDRWRRARRFARAVGLVRRDATDRRHEDATEFWLWFDALARALTTRQREALVLRYQRDLSDEEIGSILGLSASGVRSLVSRALDALRAHPELLG